MMPEMQHGQTRGQLIDRLAELEAGNLLYQKDCDQKFIEIRTLKAQIKAFRAEIQDCRDAWAPDQPPSDLRQFLIDLESTLEQE